VDSRVASNGTSDMSAEMSSAMELPSETSETRVRASASPDAGGASPRGGSSAIARMPDAESPGRGARCARRARAARDVL
jgi:hypothetical protein